ncbi:hypothetical protein C1E23_17325 [Pseudoalteromonas phenolica]|uniref:Uncharacterized protein n=1 Tax=Pseudoalteromonas phenolica TaxID=161398 RepID=A0A4Q7IJN6_9GAMM|nr:hypothetical protein C1E23_17325 [Pseudoalteromonas phenolica]
MTKSFLSPLDALSRNEVSQCEEVEAWMPTGRSFMDEFLHVIKLKCLSPPWLPSPTRQRFKLKADSEQYIDSETSSE